MNIRWVLAVIAVVFASGCASLTGSPSQNISVSTHSQEGKEIAGADCELTNSKGRWTVTTPASASINRSNDDLQILCHKEGLAPARQALVSEVKAAMVGNVLIGGGIGALIDHSTGAGYEYPAVARILMQEPGSEQSATAAPAAPPPPTAPTPRQAPVAMTAAELSQKALSREGDEWQYTMHDKRFGKSRKLLWRVKGVSDDKVHEELLVDDLPAFNWTFSDGPSLIGVPTESGLVFGQHWNGQTLHTLGAKGIGDCTSRYRCAVNAKIVGQDRITVAAGTFNALRLEGDVEVAGPPVFHGKVTIWYLEKSHRLLKQTIVINDPRYQVDEEIELTGGSKLPELASTR